jgi:hypothetical protein
MEFDDSPYSSLFALGHMPRFCESPIEAKQICDNSNWVTSIKTYVAARTAFVSEGQGKTSEESRDNAATVAFQTIERQTPDLFLQYNRESKQWLARQGKPPCSIEPKRLWPEDALTRTHVATLQPSRFAQKCRLPRGHDGYCQDVLSGQLYSGSVSSETESDSDCETDDSLSEYESVPRYGFCCKV